MATTNEKERVERYARVLYDAGVTAGRASEDLIQWRHAAKFAPEVISTITTLQEERDTGLVRKVQQRLTELVDKGDDVVVATVTTAVPLDAELRNAATKKCEELFKKKIFLVSRVEPEIVGGIIIEARGERYDASVRAQIANIRKNLSSTFMGGASDE